MVDLERITGLTTQRDQTIHGKSIDIHSNSQNYSTLLSSLSTTTKSTNLIVGGSLAGTTPVSRIFVLQDYQQEEGGSPNQVISDVISWRHLWERFVLVV